MNIVEEIIQPFIVIIRLFFEFAYSITNNQGWSIILLSFGVSLLLLPIFIFIEKAKKKNDAIKLNMKPVSDEIKRVYKGQERYYYLKTLNRQHNFSPLKALIPILTLLVQIPFFIAAYLYLENLEALKGVSFWFIPDLSKPDGLLGPVNILPIAMTVVNLVTAWFYTRFGDKKERWQMVAIAGVFLILLFKLPSGLVLYWTMNNVFSFLRLFITNKEVFKNLNLNKNKMEEIFTQLKTAFERNETSVFGVGLFATIYLLFSFISQESFIHPLSTHILQTVIAVLLIVNTLYTGYFYLKNKQHTLFTINKVLWFIEFLFIAVWIIHKIELNYLYLKLILIIILLGHFVVNHFLQLKIRGKNLNTHQQPSNKKGSTWPNIIEPVLFIVLIAVVSPLVIYLSSPENFYGLVSTLLTSQAKITILLILVITIIYHFFKKQQKQLGRFFSALSLVVVAFGFMYQKDWGIMRGYRFINEDVLDISLVTVYADIAIIVAVFLLVYRFYHKLRIVVQILVLSVILIESFSIVKKTKEQLKYEKESLSQELPEPEVAKQRLENQFALSPDKQNILVFVLDGLPGFLFEELLNEAPEYYDIFDGFTWYKNTISCGSFTFPSVSALIGGHTKTMEKLNTDDETTYRKKIENTVFTHQKAFSNAGFSTFYHKIPYFLNENKTYDTVDFKLFKNNLIDRKDLFTYRTNFVNDYATDEAKDAFSTIPIVSLDKNLLMRLTLFKIAPYVLKKIIYEEHIEASGKNSTKKKEEKIVSVKWRYRVTDSYWSSVTPLINDKSETPTIKILWTKTMCRRYHVNEEFGPPVKEIINNQYSGFERHEGKTSARYFVSKFSDLFNKLKNMGIYNNTTIVLVSDHGVHYSNDETWDEAAIHPILLVKENNSAGPLKISDKLISNADVYAITSKIGSGQSFDVIDSPINNNNKRELIYWNTGHGDKNTLDEKRVDIHFGIKLETGDKVWDKTTWDTVYINTQHLK